jgi:thiol-disulfide isomerase/thioredoxin
LSETNPTPEPTSEEVLPATPRPTWGDVSLVETGRSRSTRSEARPAARAAPGPRPKLDPATIYCDYDESHHRLNDFRLLDLDGKPVRFKDIDADLVVLDFWGTWCTPCLKSIPDLVDLQNRLRGKKIVVLGIACERDGSKTSVSRVAATARRLNINYPILLSPNDGSSPLQEILQIQAFPTLLLVDREGRVLWRDQGATRATLARLDRVLSDTSSGPSRRN